MTTKNKKGFTIIEVVLVLAIAGLIFLMVFIALPALQRSQRNTQRENDISRFMTAVQQFQANNGGKTPFEASKTGIFTKRYIDKSCTNAADNSTTFTNCGSQFTDPDGAFYQWSVSTHSNNAKDTPAPSTGNNAVTDVNHVIYVVQNGTCGLDGEVEKGTGNRQLAFVYVMEGGARYCVDNH